VELLFHQKGASASFGTKMTLSLNGVDPSYMNSITGSTCRAKCSNIFHDNCKEFNAELSNLEVIFKKSGVEAEDGHVGGLGDRLLQLIHHPGVKDDRVQEAETQKGLTINNQDIHVRV
jgi:hypothetical protein